MNAEVYKAKWGLPLMVASWVFTAILVAAPFFASWASHDRVGLITGLELMGAIILITAFFTVRSYSLSAGDLCIQRLLWITRLPLAGLQSAKADPDAMRLSLRLFGNGGLFSCTGWYWNKALGRYRAFVTDTKHAVVLQFPGRTVVVSPENPGEFVTEISRFITGNSGV